MDVGQYAGTYANSEVKFKLAFVKKGKVLTVQATGQEPADLQAVGSHSFSFPSANVLFEFIPDSKKVVFKQGNDSREFVRE